MLMAYNLPDDVTDEMVDRAAGGYDPEPPEQEPEGPYWHRDTRDGSLTLSRADGSQFADIRRNADGEFSTWIYEAKTDGIKRDYYVTEEKAMAACDKALAAEGGIGSEPR